MDEAGHRILAFYVDGIGRSGGWLRRVVFAVLQMFAVSEAVAQQPVQTPEEVFATELGQVYGDRPDFAALLERMTPLFVIPAGQPRMGAERVTLYLEMIDRTPPTWLFGEVAWDAVFGMGQVPTLVGAVRFPEGSSATVWIEVAATAPPILEFGLRFDGEVGATLRSLSEVSVGGRYLIPRDLIAVEGVLTAPGTVIAPISDARLAAAVPLLRRAEVLTLGVFIDGGNHLSISLALGSTGTPLLSALLSAAGL